MNINNLEVYGQEFSETKLTYKIKDFSKNAGAKLMYVVFLAKDVLTSSEISTKDKAIIYGALGYFILPFDIIPDFFPGGFADDLTALLFALKTVIGSINPDMRSKAVADVKEIFGEINEQELYSLF